MAYFKDKFRNKQTGLLSASDFKTLSGRVVYIIFTLLLVCVCLIAVIPAIWTLLTAFKDTQEIYGSFSFFPQELSWNRIVTRLSESWKALQLGSSFINTIILSIGNLVVKIVVCGFGGYVLSRLKPKGTKLIFALVVWTMMMPGQIRIVPNYMSWLHFPFANGTGGVNLLDTYWPMWLGAGADTFTVLLFKNSFDALSISYVEAAKLDGCSNYGVFFRIMLPLSKPIMIFVAITTLSASWSDFFTPLLVLDKHAVLPLKIYRLAKDTSIQMNTYFMGLVFAAIPPFIIFLIFQRQIMGGVNIGGVKG
ncbi:MAG: carbohydrate ABC transporter permease [Candidatus Ornithomonoglobus sp.]